MSHFTLDEKTLHAIGQNLHAEAQKLINALSEIDTTLKGLYGTSLVGETEASSKGAYEAWRTRFQTAVTDLTELGTWVNETNAAFDQLDKKTAAATQCQAPGH